MLKGEEMVTWEGQEAIARVLADMLIGTTTETEKGIEIGIETETG